MEPDQRVQEDDRTARRQWRARPRGASLRSGGRDLPYSGRVEFVESEGLGSVTAGRAETWRNDYQALLANHRAALRAETEALGWTFTVHRTDRGPTELLFALHGRMGAHSVQTAINSRHTGSVA